MKKHARGPEPAPAGAAPFERRDLALAGLIGLGVLLLYVVTLCPTIYVGDSAEFSAAAALFGVPHPPGYPLYTILAGLFVRAVPVADIAARSNLFSATCGAGAVAVLWVLLRRLGGSRPAALAATLCFAVGTTFWSQCEAAEVHALNALLIGLTLLCAFEALRAPGARAYVLTGVAFGLAVGHRNLNLLYLAPLFGLLEIARRREGGRARHLAYAVGAAAATALVYLYLPLAARRDPALDMGAPTTWRAFFDVISARAYRRHLGSGTLATDGLRLVGFLSDLPTNLGLGLIGAPLGFVAWHRRRQRPLLFGIAWLAVTSLGFATFYNVPDVASYLIPTYLALAVAAGVGFDAWRGRWQPVLCVAALMGIPLGFSSVTLRHTTIAGDYGRQLLAGAPPRALVVSMADTETHVLLYAQAVEHRREDAVVVSASEVDASEDDAWYVAQLQRRHPDVSWPGRDAATAWLEELIARNHATRPVCLTQPLALGPSGWKLVPSGLLYCLAPRVSPVDLARAVAFWRTAVTPSPAELTHADPAVRMVAFSYALSRFTLAGALAEQGDPAQAREQLTAVVALRPDASEQAIVAYMDTIGKRAHHALALGRRAEQALRLAPEDPRLLTLLRL